MICQGEEATQKAKEFSNYNLRHRLLLANFKLPRKISDETCDKVRILLNQIAYALNVDISLEQNK